MSDMGNKSYQVFFRARRRGCVRLEVSMSSTSLASDKLRVPSTGELPDSLASSVVDHPPAKESSWTGSLYQSLWTAMAGIHIRNDKHSLDFA